MNERSVSRLWVLRILVFSLFISVLGRLFAVQVVTGNQYADEAANTRLRQIVMPATRGLILDQAGRVLVGNQSTLVVSIDAATLAQMADDGDGVLERLAPLLDTTASHLRDKITVCGTPGAKRPPLCWNGSLYQPIPVAKGLPMDKAVQMMERRTDFPGVSATVEAVRTIPNTLGVNLAHVLGYLGPVNDAELAAHKAAGQALKQTDLIGRAGLEATYDDVLRGKAGVTTLSIDRSMAVIGTVSKTPQQPGSYLVLSIDAALQKVAEQQLAAAVARARKQGFAGDSGAVVVMDVTNGRVLALASYPTYNPRMWLDGVTDKEYRGLTNAKSNLPLINRAIQGLYPPASTFKMITTVAAGRARMPLTNTTYPCPSGIKIGDRLMRNHESHAYGNISVTRALEVSCNTVFYKIGYDMWLRDGGNNPISRTNDWVQNTALDFGLGSKTGVDLPAESRGRVGGRAYKLSQYAQYKDAWCYRAKVGYPELSDKARAAYLKLLAAENCVDGNKVRGGDAANLAIGQGDTVVTPLQMAVAYAALANGGNVWEPQLVKAIISPDGKSVTKIKPKKKQHVRIPSSMRRYLLNAFHGVVTSGTGVSPFYAWPQSVAPIAAKTGSGEVNNQDPTSWFNSFGPGNQPKYEVVMMVSQGGTGALTSGPSVRKIWEALLGVKGKTRNIKESVLVGGQPATLLPQVAADGSVQSIPGTAAANTVLYRRYIKAGASG